MKRWVISYIGLLLFTASALITPALASDVSNANYYGIISASNNSTAATSVSVNISGLNSTKLINMGWLNATATNYAIQKSGIDIKSMPGYDDAPWVMFVSSIGQNTTDAYSFYTDTVTGYTPVYFPGGDGMTTADITPDFGDNWTVEQSGWMDTTAGYLKWLLEKSGALISWIDSETDGTVNAAILESSETANTTLAASDGNDNVYGANWDAQTFTPNNTFYCTKIVLYSQKAGSPTGNAVIGIRETSGGQPTGSDITSGSVLASTFGAWGNHTITLDTPVVLNAGVQYAWVFRVPSGTAGNQIDVGYNSAGGISNGSRVTSSDSGATWTTQAQDYRCSIYGYEFDASLAATGVSSEEHTRQAKQDGVFFGLAIDDDVILPVADNLAINMPMWQEECDGATFTTIDGNELTATVTSATWSAGNGYLFDGDNDVITIADNAAIQNIFDGGGAVEFWINPASDGEGSDARIAEKASKWQIMNRSEAAGKVKIYFSCVFDGNDGEWVTTSTAVNLNEWTHLMIVYNSDATTNDPIFYINGAALTVGSGLTETTTPTGTRESDAGVTLYIGNRADNARTFDGYIGEGRLYTAALISGQITQNYNATKIIYDGTTDKDIYSTLASVPDNANDIVTFQNYSMIYAEYQEIIIGGSQQQYIEWEYGTTFTDQSGNGNDATPSFRTTSSDADVSASLINFEPTARPIAPAYTVGDGPDFYSDNISITEEFTANVTGGATGYPGQRLINALSVSTSTPQQFPEIIIWAFLILAISVTLSIWIKSAFVKMVWLAVGLGFGIAVRDETTGLGVFDLWMLVFFMMFAIMVLYAANERTRA